MNASLIRARLGAGALAGAMLVASCHGGEATGPGGGATTSATSSGSGGSGGSLFSGGHTGGMTPDGGCPGDGSVGGGADASTGCEGIEGGVSYVSDVSPIFAQNCSGELCHLTPSRGTLVGVPSSGCCDGRLLVAPGDAAHSYLVDELTDYHLCGGGGMPLGQPPLADADILTIRRWICEGAPPD